MREWELWMIASSWCAAVASWVGLLFKSLGLFCVCFVCKANAVSIVEKNELSDNVDVIELNHFHDCCGRHVYDQLIFWRFDEPTKEYHVRGWTIVNQYEWKHVEQNSSFYSVRYSDLDRRIYRTVTASNYRESWTQRDPERDKKMLLEESQRIALTRPKKELMSVLLATGDDK